MNTNYSKALPNLEECEQRKGMNKSPGKK